MNMSTCATEMCSSEVPGGASTMRKSKSPQSTSFRNCRQHHGGSAGAVCSLPTLERQMDQALHGRMPILSDVMAEERVRSHRR
jgi:hypothetical protein